MRHSNDSLLFAVCVSLGALFVMGVYDVFLFVNFGRDATISRQILLWSRSYPEASLAAAFALGVLAGHLFWPQHWP